jgi:hypothetical protein
VTAVTFPCLWIILRLCNYEYVFLPCVRLTIGSDFVFTVAFPISLLFLGMQYIHIYIIQGPAEIPDDLQTQLRVEPLARGICP